MTTRRQRRPGMSLLEVILALATFLMSISGLVFLMSVASDHALEAQMRSQAISVAQSRLAEAAAGAVPLEGRGLGPCEDDSDYEWSMDVEPGGFDGLYNVTVHVSRKRANGTQLKLALSQIVLDPARAGTVFDGAKELQSPSTDSTTDPMSTTDPSSSSSGGNAASGTGAQSKGGSQAKGGNSPSKGGGNTTQPSTKGGNTQPNTKGGTPSPSRGK